MNQTYVMDGSRDARLEVVLDFLRTNSRFDGVVTVTTKDVVAHLRFLGEDLTKRSVQRYLSVLEDQGHIQSLPYTPDLALPVQGRRYHGFKKQVLKLTHT